MRNRTLKIIYEIFLQRFRFFFLLSESDELDEEEDDEELLELLLLLLDELLGVLGRSLGSIIPDVRFEIFDDLNVENNGRCCSRRLQNRQFDNLFQKIDRHD